MRIACLQFSPQVGDIDNNLNRADAVLNKAQDLDNLDLLVLPELAFTGYNFESLAHITPHLEPSCSGITSLWARTTALKLNCNVVAGYPEKVDITSRWPASPEFYNSAIIVSRDGDTIANYRKSFLYAIDETWALEGQDGFYADEIPDLGSVAVGICMDINPYKFEAPWSAFEFAYHVLEIQANLVIISMAWLTQEDRSSFSQYPLEPDLETLYYWIQRLEPVIRSESDEEVIVVFCNRTGIEGDAVYAGTSAVVGIKEGEVCLYGILGRGVKEVLVVDTSLKPVAKLVSEVVTDEPKDQTPATPGFKPKPEVAKEKPGPENKPAAPAKAEPGAEPRPKLAAGNDPPQSTTASTPTQDNVQRAASPSSFAFSAGNIPIHSAGVAKGVSSRASSVDSNKDAASTCANADAESIMEKKGDTPVNSPDTVLPRQRPVLGLQIDNSNRVSVGAFRDAPGSPAPSESVSTPTAPSPIPDDIRPNICFSPGGYSMDGLYTPYSASSGSIKIDVEPWIETTAALSPSVPIRQTRSDQRREARAPKPQPASPPMEERKNAYAASTFFQIRSPSKESFGSTKGNASDGGGQDPEFASRLRQSKRNGRGHRRHSSGPHVTFQGVALEEQSQYQPSEASTRKEMVERGRRTTREPLTLFTNFGLDKGAFREIQSAVDTPFRSQEDAFYEDIENYYRIISPSVSRNYNRPTVSTEKTEILSGGGDKDKSHNADNKSSQTTANLPVPSKNVRPGSPIPEVTSISRPQSTKSRNTSLPRAPSLPRNSSLPRSLAFDVPRPESRSGNATRYSDNIESVPIMASPSIFQQPPISISVALQMASSGQNGLPKQKQPQQPQQPQQPRQQQQPQQQRQQQQPQQQQQLQQQKQQQLQRQQRQQQQNQQLPDVPVYFKADFNHSNWKKQSPIIMQRPEHRRLLSDPDLSSATRRYSSTTSHSEPTGKVTSTDMATTPDEGSKTATDTTTAQSPIIRGRQPSSAVDSSTSGLWTVPDPIPDRAAAPGPIGAAVRLASTESHSRIALGLAAGPGNSTSREGGLPSRPAISPPAPSSTTMQFLNDASPVPASQSGSARGLIDPDDEIVAVISLVNRQCPMHSQRVRKSGSAPPATRTVASSQRPTNQQTPDLQQLRPEPLVLSHKKPSSSQSQTPMTQAPRHSQGAQQSSGSEEPEGHKETVKSSMSSEQSADQSNGSQEFIQDQEESIYEVFLPPQVRELVESLSSPEGPLASNSSAVGMALRTRAAGGGTTPKFNPPTPKAMNFGNGPENNRETTEAQTTTSADIAMLHATASGGNVAQSFLPGTSDPVSVKSPPVAV